MLILAPVTSSPTVPEGQGWARIGSKSRDENTRATKHYNDCESRTCLCDTVCALCVAAHAFASKARSSAFDSEAFITLDGTSEKKVSFGYIADCD